MQGSESSLAMLLLLGAVHGVNPGMGWLFAVSLGLQERRRGAVWAALGPLALGHATAIAVVVLLASWIGVVLPLGTLRWAVAAALLAMGVLHLAGHRHAGYGGMRVGFRELTVWSFLMASAHGAGLMALPFVLGLRGAGAAAPGHPHGAAAVGGGHAEHLAAAAIAWPGPEALLATLIHSLGYLAMAALVAVVVYEKLGLRLLRSAWINLDLIWGIALIGTAVLTVVL